MKLRGRIDRLELDHKDRPVVIDVKTGKTPISKADAQDHAQLATYQVALKLGGVPGAGGDNSAGGETGGDGWSTCPPTIAAPALPNASRTHPMPRRWVNGSR